MKQDYNRRAGQFMLVQALGFGLGAAFDLLYLLPVTLLTPADDPEATHIPVVLIAVDGLAGLGLMATAIGLSSDPRSHLRAVVLFEVLMIVAGIVSMVVTRSAVGLVAVGFAIAVLVCLPRLEAKGEPDREVTSPE